MLLRTLQPKSNLTPVAERAIAALRSRRETIWVCTQSLMELWELATRPVADNGLSLSPAEAFHEIAAVKQYFPLLPKTPVYATWEALVTAHHVIGKNTHDARLVATMIQHRIDSILTFSAQDFVRYSQIKVLHPQAV